MLILTLFVSISFISCQSGTGTNSEVVPGTMSTTELSGWTLHIDTTYFDQSAAQLVARGGLVNMSRSDIASPSDLEGCFYTDLTCEEKLGTVHCRIHPILAGEERQWSLRFSGAGVDLSQYTDFMVKGFRLVVRSEEM